MPKRLRADLAVLGTPGSAIKDHRRDAARGGQRFLELRHLANWHEVVLGPCQDEDIRLYALSDARERILLQGLAVSSGCFVPRVHMPLLTAQPKPGDHAILARISRSITEPKP